jgi:hypothetical protein
MFPKQIVSKMELRTVCGIPYASTNLQNKFNSAISAREPAVVLAILESATTMAKHWAREIATLILFLSRIKLKPRDPYSP